MSLNQPTTTPRPAPPAPPSTRVGGSPPLRPGSPARDGQPAATPAAGGDRLVWVAAAADLHQRVDPHRRFRRSFVEAASYADVLLIGGDLTSSGLVQEAHIVAEDVEKLGIPVIAVTGNHDHSNRHTGKIIDILADAGVQVLEGEGTVLTCGGVRLGVAGCKGYGGGFGDAVVHEHGEPQTRAFVRHTRTSASKLAAALSTLDCDVKVVLTHYAPITGTLAGEPRELYLMLGSERLGRVIDQAGVSLAIHGHAHHGREHGQTPGGVPVRNVAYKVIKTAYRLYTLQPTNSGRWHVIDQPQPNHATRPR